MRKISKLPVLDKSNSLVGIITKNDLQKAGPSDASTLDIYELGYLLSKLKVEKIMIKKVLTVDINEVVEEAARIMADGDFGCLPVMKDNLLVGIITDSDLFRMFIEMFSARTSGVRAIVQMSDEPGSLSVFTQKIAMAGGIIISCITTEAENPAFRKVTVKATNKINIARFKEGSKTAEVKEIWQWDYGQILRIQGLNLPTAVEIHFSLDEHGGEAVRRIGVTKDGVTDVPIPDSMD